MLSKFELSDISAQEPSVFFFRSIQREKKNILELLKRRQDAQEEELKQNLKLEQDVEMEKLRKVKQPFLCVNKLEFISAKF